MLSFDYSSPLRSLIESFDPNQPLNDPFQQLSMQWGVPVDQIRELSSSASFNKAYKLLGEYCEARDKKNDESLRAATAWKRARANVGDDETMVMLCVNAHNAQLCIEQLETFVSDTIRDLSFTPGGFEPMDLDDDDVDSDLTPLALYRKGGEVFRAIIREPMGQTYCYQDGIGAFWDDDRPHTGRIDVDPSLCAVFFDLLDQHLSLGVYEPLIVS